MKKSKGSSKGWRSRVTPKNKKKVQVLRADPAPELAAMKQMLVDRDPIPDAEILFRRDDIDGWLRIVPPDASDPDRDRDTENDYWHGNKTVKKKGECFFVLVVGEQKLKFYKDSECKEELGAYDLKTIISVDQPPDLACTFRLTYYNLVAAKTPFMGPRTLLLKAADENESIAWASSFTPWVRAFRTSINLEVPTFKVLLKHKGMVGQYASFVVMTDLDQGIIVSEDGGAAAAEWKACFCVMTLAGISVYKKRHKSMHTATPQKLIYYTEVSQVHLVRDAEARQILQLEGKVEGLNKTVGECTL
jgi:hypothetical protein